MNRQAGRPSGGHRQGMRRVTAICWLVASSSWLGCAGEGTAPDLSANRAPESARRLPTVAQWWLGGPVDLPVRPYFTDPDGIPWRSRWSTNRLRQVGSAFLYRGDS